MQISLPAASTIIPLLITTAAFRWFPRSDSLGPVLIGSLLMGWIGMGFSSMARLWLKVLILIVYPFAMWIAATILMVLIYGLPGL